MADVQVIGAGFSGLAAAYFLNRAGHRVRIVEKRDRLGGMVGTLRTPYGLIETAANSVIANRTVEEVAADLGLPLVSTQKAARKRFILREKRLRRWPLHTAATMRLLGMALPLRFGRVATPLAPRAGESVNEWGERAVGREATDYLLTPALAGVFGGDPARLSARLTVGRFFEPRRERVLPKGKLRGSVAPAQGMGAWAPAFRRMLEINHCTFEQDPLAGLPTVVALPPPAALDFLGSRAPALTAELRKITMLPLVSVTVFFPPETAGVPGFGCLFPRPEGFRPLGVLANERIFPGRALDAISETWILGGALDREVVELPDHEILRIVLDERARLHGLRPRVLLSRVTKWPQAVPHYDLALEHALTNLRALQFREGTFRLFGTYLGELGLGSVLHRASFLPREFP